MYAVDQNSDSVISPRQYDLGCHAECCHQEWDGNIIGKLYMEAEGSYVISLSRLILMWANKEKIP